MAAGYAFGKIVILPPERRSRLCLAIGLAAIALFLVLRGFNLYGDPRPWHVSARSRNGMPPMPALFSFLSTTKYPASLGFLLMTLGPIIALIPLVENLSGSLPAQSSLRPRAVLLLHAAHSSDSRAGVAGVEDSAWVRNPWLFANHPMGNPEPPDGYTWSLPLLYAVWAIAIALLYPACRWMADVKARHGDEWLRYF